MGFTVDFDGVVVKNQLDMTKPSREANFGKWVWKKTKKKKKRDLGFWVREKNESFNEEKDYYC